MKLLLCLLLRLKKKVPLAISHDESGNHFITRSYFFLHIFMKISILIVDHTLNAIVQSTFSTYSIEFHEMNQFYDIK